MRNDFVSGKSQVIRYGIPRKQPNRKHQVCIAGLQ